MWRTNTRLGRCVFIVTAALSSSLACSADKESSAVILENHEPILKVFPPPAAERSEPGVGKFVIFTREPTGKEHDWIAGAWECIPSLPKVPITKRVEFCHSSWCGSQLLDTLVADDSHGMYPRFVTLLVDSANRTYSMNLYDINYRTWEVHCIWQGSRFNAFGVMDDSIFCNSSDGWLLINATSGRLSHEIPFVPLYTAGGFWIVRKPGETEGCWSYDPKKRQYIAHFGRVDPPKVGFAHTDLSADGKSRAWVLAPRPDSWRGGTLGARLILQREGQSHDISVPIEMQAVPGSGVPVIPKGIQLKFAPEGKLRLRAWIGDEEGKDRVWTVDTATGKVHSYVAPHTIPAQDTWATFDGVPVADYLRQNIGEFRHFGRGGLAAAFLLHMGILEEKPEYSDCTVGVSRDGRHVLYRADNGPLAGVLIYGDLLTKQTVRWESPDELNKSNVEFVWAEAPADTEKTPAPAPAGN